ncbi:MAG: 50S ribosomal protein L25 [Acidobacteria bacterium]|nr:50S ribosomal protein L25 [Acidobacteriota bacterium]MBI3657203.1 50S ribosomal protein L25 [Acidobacteriota bacterium]
MQQFLVNATVRSSRGKNEARRLRQQGWIPAVFYGKGQTSAALSVTPADIQAVLRSETGHNTIFLLKMDSQHEANVLIRDYQVDPVRGHLLHVDLLNVAMDVKLKVRVPVETVGVPEGVKLQGGILDVVTKEIEVECLPADIPDHIKVDVSNLKIGDVVRVQSVAADPKLRYVTEKDVVIATVSAPRLEEAPKPEEAVAAPTEPEVIKKGKAVTEEGVPGTADKPEKK